MVIIIGNLVSFNKVSFKTCLGYGSILLECDNLNMPSYNFYENKSKYKDGYCPYCKDCCEKIFKNMLSECGNNLEMALYYTCQLTDYPLLSSILEYMKSILKSDKLDNITFSYYISLLFESEKYDKLKTFKDTDVELDDIEQVKKDNTNKRKSVSKEYRYTWGLQDSIEDYEFLQNTYERYTKNVEFTNAEQEDLFKDLCQARLSLRKINDGTYKGEETIEKVQNRVTKIMSVLNLDNYENTAPKTLSEQALFERIRLCSDNDVHEVYQKKDEIPKDINRIKEYNEKFVLRPLLNTLAGHRDFNINLDDVDKYGDLND